MCRLWLPPVKLEASRRKTINFPRQIRAQDKGVACVLAFGDRGDRKPLRKNCRQVFQRVNGDVNAFIKQRFLQLFSEHAAAADDGERRIFQPIARRLDDFDMHREVRTKRGKFLLHPLRLPQRETRAARTDY